MSGPVFTINFRREAFERDLARSRQRITRLAAWMAYFGLMGLVLYGYTLNLAAMNRRTFQVERQTEQFAESQNLPRKVPLDPTQIAAIERFHLSPRRWRDKLARLSKLTPDNVSLSSVAVNPGNSNQPLDQNKLVLSGTLRGASGEDPMRGVVQLVAALQADSAFAAGYQNIKLSQGRAAGTSAAVTEFTIECR